MDADNTVPETKVPVLVPEPEEHAPPTLAEPASGPVAEMSGALKGEQPGGLVPNGDTQSAAPVTDPAPGVSGKPSTALESSEAPIAQDTEMKDTSAEEPIDTTIPESAPDVNGTGKKNGNGNGDGKRKSLTGVPEHKNKKLNKKKSVSKITHLDAQPGDYFFARLKSYPPWPSMICDEEILPASLLNTRPVTTKKADGTYNESYADGGKKVQERTFPVMFLYTNEFAWIPNTDLGELNTEDCKDVAEKGKAKSLIAAYHVAAENHDLQYFKDMLIEHAKAMEEDEARKAELQAEKADKAAKKKRKSEIKADNDDVDTEDVDESAEVKKSSKKRKKAAEGDDEDTEKAAKTPKTTKLKLTTNKTPATTEKKTKEKAAKPKSEKRKSKAAVEDEDMADAPEAEPEAAMDPEEARKARDREVLFLRHKLQKGFLSRDQAPQEEDMPQMSQYVKKLENYEELEVAIIRHTKINKVLKALVKLNTIPRDEEFEFRKRSMELLGKWNKMLGAEPHDSDDKEPNTNGVHGDAAAAENKVEEDAVESKADALVPEESKQPTVETTASATEPGTVAEPLKAAEPIAAEEAPEPAKGAAVAAEVVRAAE